MNWSLYVVFVSFGMSFLSMLRSTVKKGECNVEKSFFVKFQMYCESKDIYMGAPNARLAPTHVVISEVVDRHPL